MVKRQSSIGRVEAEVKEGFLSLGANSSYDPFSLQAGVHSTAVMECSVLS